MSRRLRIVLALSLAGGACLPAVAQAADRAIAEAVYAQYVADADVAAGWTGSTETCTVGEESPESLAATLRTVNGVRALMGVSPVVFDPAFNRLALASSLIMRAHNSLSHYPDATWRCYSAEGYQGASHSNLYLGRSGASAIVGYMHDEGVYSLGHRLWIADPGQRTMGSGSTGTSNSLYVIGGDQQASTQPTAWPPAGWIPGSWVPLRWSYTVRPMCNCVVGDIAVTVTRDGAPVAVGEVSLLGGGYGSGTTIAWDMPPESVRVSRDATFAVRITGVRTTGASIPVDYTVSAIAPVVAPDTGVPEPVGNQDQVDWRGGLTALRVTRKGRVLTVRYVARQAGRLRVQVAAQRFNRSVPGVRAGRPVAARSGTFRVRLKPAHIRASTRLYISAGLVGVDGSISRTLRVR